MESIHKMRIFVEVYQTLSITHAAEALHTTQPAVSRIIMELEDEYCVRLFERFHRRLSPTVSAHELYKKCTHILDCVDEMNSLFDSRSETILRIGSSITIGNILLPRIIQNFNDELPYVNTEVLIANGASLQQKLLSNELDAALIEDSVHEEELETIPFYHDEMILILPNEHPMLERDSIRLHDLTQYPFLMREKGSAGREYLEHLFALKDIQIHPLWQSTSTHALINAVSSGIGLSILPRMLCEEALLHIPEILSGLEVPQIHSVVQRSLSFQV